MYHFPSPRGSCFTTVTGLNSFVEPNFLVYEVHCPLLDRALAKFQSMLSFGVEEKLLVTRCREGRMSRIRLSEERVRETVCRHSFYEVIILIKCQTSLVLEVAQAKSTHWRYAIFATRCLRTLVRKDSPTSAALMKYFLEKCYDNHPSLVSVSQLSCLENTTSVNTTA
jgi:proteasome activator subunit 4